MKKLTWALVLIFPVVVAWLVMSPVRLNIVVNDLGHVSCQPLGWGLNSSTGDHRWSQFELVERDLESSGADRLDEPYRSREEADVSDSYRAACQDARQGRQTTVLVVVALGVVTFLFLRRPVWGDAAVTPPPSGDKA